jgi:hypothetical protein
MLKRAYEPCLPTIAAPVPTGPEWLHELKHDGLRLLTHRDGNNVRLFTRTGHRPDDRLSMCFAPHARLALNSGSGSSMMRSPLLRSATQTHHRRPRPSSPPRAKPPKPPRSKMTKRENTLVRSPGGL